MAPLKYTSTMTDAILSAYRAADSKLLLLDYDGVLAPIVARPEQARPTAEILELLRSITAQRGVKVVIISGRDRGTLEDWLGSLPVDMSAEHGHFYKESGTWRSVTNSDMAWREDVETMMERLVASYPGSHIESKQMSRVWHYREATAPVDEQAAVEELTRAARGRAVVMPGKRVIDVRALGADKGEAARHWYDQQAWDFVLCIGDDTTDEAMFMSLPAPAFTVKVGTGTTAARYAVRNQGEAEALLGQFVKSSHNLLLLNDDNNS